MNFFEKALSKSREKAKKLKKKEKAIKELTDSKTGEKYYVTVEEREIAKGVSNIITFRIRNSEGEEVSTASLLEVRGREGGKELREASITRVRTNGKYLKKGFADAVLGFAEQEAFIRGYDKVNLVSVSKASDEMYKKRGYDYIAPRFFKSLEKKITPKSWIDRRKIVKGKQKR